MYAAKLPVAVTVRCSTDVPKVPLYDFFLTICSGVNATSLLRLCTAPYSASSSLARLFDATIISGVMVSAKTSSADFTITVSFTPAHCSSAASNPA